MDISNSSHNRLAVACLLFSASMWGLIWYPIRLLEEAGMSAVWTSLVMYIAAGLLVIPVLWRQYHIISQHFSDLFLLAIAAGVTNVTFFNVILFATLPVPLLVYFGFIQFTN